MINKEQVTALICECNPFHEGHKRIITKAKENADFLVCIMSPDFVQRGEPAVYDKYKRTEILLKNGADLVIELPIEYALSSARYFAKAGVYIADKLGFVDNLIFGSFVNDFDKIKQIADITYDVKEEFDKQLNSRTNNRAKNKNHRYNNDSEKNYNEKIKSNLQKGMSYPKALSMSMGIDLYSNDILNIEYLNALRELKSNIKPIIVERKKDIKGASDIRKTMKDIVTLDNFSDYLNQILFYSIKNNNDYLDFYGIDESFNNSLLNISNINMSFSERVEKLSTKNRTVASVKRNLLHILLDIKKKDLKSKNYFSKYNYIRILGFSDSFKNNIKKIELPYLLGYTKKELERFDTNFYNHEINRSILLNIYASDLYQYVSGSDIFEANRKIVK